MFVFLDDERLPVDVTWLDLPKTSAKVVRQFNEFVYEVIESLKNHEFTIISFDHDLQLFKDGNEITGYTCLKWLVDYMIDHNIPKYKVECVFHTKNEVGKINMQRYWENYIKHG